MRIFATKQEKLDGQLFKAIEKRAYDDIARLLKAGANPDARRNVWEQTPLIVAASDAIYNVEIMRMLLDAGADPNAKTTHGDTALHWTICRKKSLEEIEMLVLRGANINIQNFSGVTPLHLAAQKLDRDIVTYLIDKGGDTTLKDKHYSTPIDYSRNKSYGFSRFMEDYIAAKNAPKESLPPCEWTLSAEDEVARVFIRDKIGYTMTEIFNFTARTYTHISRNMTTNAESQSQRFFEEFPDLAPIEDAYAALLRNGGNGNPPQISVGLGKDALIAADKVGRTL